MKRRWPLLAAPALVLAIGPAACDNMANQPKRLPFELPEGAQSRRWPALPPEGTVARDDEPPPAPPPVTLALLRRGQERFDIYCAPCHGATGDGHGRIVQRGFPNPPSYNIARLREAPNQHFYDVITQGYGVMFPYAQRVAPPDRWAITAYVRALQASSNAQFADIPADQRQSLQ